MVTDTTDFHSRLPEPTKDQIDYAEKFLNIPVWSLGYARCNTPESEITCKQLLVAAGAIENYEKKVANGQCRNYVYAKISSLSLEDQMSVIYHGFQMAIASNRYFVTDIDDFPIKLPSIITVPPKEFKGEIVEEDVKFGCMQGPYKPNVTLQGTSWPQVIYTNHVYAPLLKKRFGFHSAYFAGSYLFGQIVSIACDSLYKTVVEVWEMPQHQNGDLSVGDYYKTVSRCGVDHNEAHLITHSSRYNAKSNFKTHKEISDTQSRVCALKQMIGSKRFVQTFGSRLGWWGMALNGNAAGAINSVDNICFNITNSQRGSLWHTYFKYRRTDAYRINSWFYVCGMNVEAAHEYSVNLI